MRISRDEIAQREAFVMELFKNDPSMSGTAVQDRVKAQFGKMMRPNRIYDLRRENAQKILAQQSPVTPTESASEI